jgi:hypothetical protein
MVTNFWARNKAAVSTINPVPITSFPNITPVLILSSSLLVPPSVFQTCLH